MKREIKFREFNGFEMLYEPFVSMISTASINERFIDNDIMQFTGLKDIKDNDIYEGDILKVIIRALPKGKDATGYTYIGEVRFEYGKFIIKFKEKFKLNNELHIWALNHCEVIGNIFEHPNLLHTGA